MENEKLVEQLQRPIGSGGTSSEDSYKIYDPLRLEAAEALTLAQARIKVLTNEVGILLANIRQIEEATGEGPEGEDAQIVDQIERDHEARQALTGASDAG